MRGSVWATRASIHALVRPRAFRNHTRIFWKPGATRAFSGKRPDSSRLLGFLHAVAAQPDRRTGQQESRTNITTGSAMTLARIETRRAK